MTVVAFDSKEFNRGLGKTFFACLGVGVEIKNEQNFRKEYISSFEKISKDFSFNTTRKIYKAYDMGQKLGFGKAIAFWEKFLTELQDFIVKLNVYYTILPPSKIKKGENVWCTKIQGEGGWRIRFFEKVESCVCSLLCLEVHTG